jgi:hypothetical protein
MPERGSGMIPFMRSPSRLAPGLLLVLAPMLAGCGGDSDNTTDDAAPPSSSTPSVPPTSQPATADTSVTSTDTGATSTAPSGAGLPDACDVLTPTDVQAAFGVEFGAGQQGGGGTAEGDLQWQSDNCSFKADGLVEVELALTGPDDFSAGDFQCPEPSGIASTVTPADVPGATAAWWDVDDDPPLEATLRLCTDAFNVDIGLDYEDGVDFQGVPKDQAIALAGVVLAKLG